MAKNPQLFLTTKFVFSFLLKTKIATHEEEDETIPSGQKSHANNRHGFLFSY